MGYLAFMIWAGGVATAYRRDRLRFGPFRAGCEAVVWPAGLGYRLARDFYVNEDWPDEEARRKSGAGARGKTAS